MKRICIALLIAIVSHGASAQDAKPGSVAAGEKKIAMCIGCHGIKGYQASFPEVYKVPMISGQNAKYIAAALNAYKKGERKHPTMKGIAMSLTDTDIADISAYYEQHAGPAGAVPDKAADAPTAVAELLTKGACVSCHGANFNKPIDGAYPKLAGQHADFLYVALKAYKTEGNAKVGRANAIMGGQVKQFNLKELQAMAEYISSLPGDMKVVPQSKFR
jgi:cytochrome c553